MTNRPGEVFKRDYIYVSSSVEQQEVHRILSEDLKAISIAPFCRARDSRAM